MTPHEYQLWHQEAYLHGEIAHAPRSMELNLVGKRPKGPWWEEFLWSFCGSCATTFLC